VLGAPVVAEPVEEPPDCAGFVAVLDFDAEPETEFALSDEPELEVLLARMPESVTASKLLAAF